MLTLGKWVLRKHRESAYSLPSLREDQEAGSRKVFKLRAVVLKIEIDQKI